MEESASQVFYSRIPAKYWLRNGHQFSVYGHVEQDIPKIRTVEQDKIIDAEAMFFAELLDSVYLDLEYIKREQYVKSLSGYRPVSSPVRSPVEFTRGSEEFLDVTKKKENYKSLIQNFTLHETLKNTYDTQCSFLERRKQLVSEEFYTLCKHFFLCDYIFELSLCYIQYADGDMKAKLKEMLLQYRETIQNDDLLFSYRYRSMIRMYNNILKGDNKGTDIADNVVVFSTNTRLRGNIDADISEYWQIAKENFSGKTEEHIAFEYAKAAISKKDFAFVNQYLNQTTNEAHLNYIKIRLDVAMQNDALERGIISSDTLFRPDGSKIDMQEALKQHKGKYIFIDIWASWCASCRVMMPQSLKLERQFKNTVEFIYISIDESFTAWTQAIKKEGLNPSNCYLISKKSPFMMSRRQNLFLPRYMLIDSEGKIVHNNCFHPDDKYFVEKMNHIINQK